MQRLLVSGCRRTSDVEEPMLKLSAFARLQPVQAELAAYHMIWILRPGGPLQRDTLVRDGPRWIGKRRPSAYSDRALISTPPKTAGREAKPSI